MTHAHLWFFAAIAALYAIGRMTLAYGLWQGRSWAEWLTHAAAAIYLPVEIYQLCMHLTWIKIAIFVINLAIVAYLA